VLGIVIIVIVFWLGLALGRLEGELLSSGSGRMMYRPYSGYSRSYPTMVQNGHAGMSGAPSAASPATTNQ
jgi:hypothetical protein